MDRAALILYLENVRDLEVAKEVTTRKWKEKRNEKEAEIGKYDLNPTLEARHSEDTSWSGKDFKEFLLLVIGFCFFFIPVAVFIAQGIVFKLLGLFIIMLIPTVIIGFILVYAIVDSFGAKEKIKYLNKMIDERNEKRIEQREKDREKVSQLEYSLRMINEEYSDGLSKIDSLLTNFYAMNIIPKDFRGLEYSIYLYENMCTSSLSFEQMLVHAQIAEGIRQITERLDQIIAELELNLYETRCSRIENEDYCKKIIDQNNRMIKNLEKNAENTREAAQYAKLAANYSKANALFSLATYLR